MVTRGNPPFHEECAAAYHKWWEEWVNEQGLLPVLILAPGVSDVFGAEGNVCQAAVLWDIRNRAKESPGSTGHFRGDV